MYSEYDFFRNEFINEISHIPGEFCPIGVVDHDDLTTAQKDLLETTSSDFIFRINHQIYKPDVRDVHVKIDSEYIAYEYLIYKKLFHSNRHYSYQQYMQNPYGPYKNRFRSTPSIGFNSGIFATSKMKALSTWTGNLIFGKYRGHRVLNNGIRLLSHTGGFALFIPPEIFHKFDKGVRISLPPDMALECWIAGKGYAFVKVDVRAELLEDDSGKLYIDDDLEVALDRIEKFTFDNYVNAPQLYPDSDYFTIGSYLMNPDAPRPFRIRLGGEHSVRF